MSVRRFVTFETEGQIGAYLHGTKIGVVVDMQNGNAELIKDIAMHVAAVSPVSVTREEVPAEMVEREKDIYINQAKDSGKPENIIEKIVSGKIEKYLSEICLMDQKFVKNPDLSIQDLLNELIAKMGENISVKRFARFQIGA